MVKVENFKNNSISYLSPEIRIYESPNILTYEASIRSGLLKGVIDQTILIGQNIIMLSFKKNPLYCGFGYQ